MSVDMAARYHRYIGTVVLITRIENKLSLPVTHVNLVMLLSVAGKCESFQSQCLRSKLYYVACGTVHVGPTSLLT